LLYYNSHPLLRNLNARDASLRIARVLRNTTSSMLATYSASRCLHQCTCVCISFLYYFIPFIFLSFLCSSLDCLYVADGTTLMHAGFPHNKSFSTLSLNQSLQTILNPHKKKNTYPKNHLSQLHINPHLFPSHVPTHLQK
jgi:hypothetical protein